MDTESTKTTDPITLDDPVDRRLTLKDVAAALNVSPMTVSNAYNRPDQIAPATRARVLAEAARLGYSGPNPTARSLRQRRARVVGLLFAGPLSYAFFDPAAVIFLQGVSLATEAARLGLLLLSASDPDDPTLINEASMDGLIAFSMADYLPLLDAAARRRLPLVLVDQPARLAAATVGIDDEAGARAAAAHVATLGHRRVGIISLRLERGVGRSAGPVIKEGQAGVAHPVAWARLHGYFSALEEAGVPRDAVPVYECVAHGITDGAAAAAWLLSREPRPTAILAMSDQLALGALDAARHLGLRVPDDLSILGFDDIPAAARAEPGLTTVHQPLEEKGFTAGRLLIEAVREEHGSGPSAVVLETELIVRGSTAPPATSSR